MKKIIAVTLVTGLLASTGAFAASTGKIDPIQLASTTFLPVGSLTQDINIARQGRLLAQPNRAGFVKNSFDFTVSANVIGGVFEDPANSRFGVVAASNKGYNVFTGSSVGGSISQCGEQVDKKTKDLGASLVIASTLNLDNANGCNR